MRLGPFETVRPAIRQHRWRMILGGCSTMLTDLAQLAVPAILRTVIDKLTAGAITTDELMLWAFALIGLACMLGIGRFGWRFLSIGAALKIEEWLRNRFYEHLQTLSYSYYNRTKVGDLMAHATNDLEAVRMSFGFGIILLVDTTVLTTLALVMMLSINTQVTLVILAPLVAVPFVVRLAGNVWRRRFRAVQDSFSSLTELVQETFSGIRVVKSYVQEKAEEVNFGKRNDDYLNKSIRMVNADGVFEGCLWFTVGLSQAVLLLYGGRLALTGVISLGEFVAIGGYLQLMVWPMIGIGWAVGLFQRGWASMDRINKVLNTEPDVKDHEGVIDPGELKGEVEFKDCVFTFPDGAEPALKGVSFKIPAGSTAAFLGRTGSGKSCIAQLLAHLFPIERGQVFVDGIDVNDLPLKKLRSSIGFVPQEPYLFSMRIEENIRFGKPNLDPNRVISHARMAMLDNEVEGFPEGYDTVVGERGTGLSGGQKQRAAIARATAVEPKILVLDDAMSAVDTRTEEGILNGLRDFMQGRTTILISHRISTIKEADIIFVLEDGRITASGSHDELKVQDGLYREIYELQKLEEAYAQSG